MRIVFRFVLPGLLVNFGCAGLADGSLATYADLHDYCEEAKTRGPSAVGMLLAPVASSVWVNGGNLSDDNAKVKEYLKFRGTWVVASGERRGRALDEDLMKQIRLEFRGSKLTVFIDGVGESCEFTIDPTKNPKQIDVVREIEGKKFINGGIYAFDAGTLKYSSSEVGRDWPTEFETSKNTSHTLLVLKRIKQQEPSDSPD